MILSPAVRRRVRAWQRSAPALPYLQQAAKEHVDPEVRRRAADLARTISQGAFVQVRVFDAPPLQGNRRWLARVVVTPDGKRAVTAGDECLILWDIASGKVVRAFGQNQKAYWSLALSGDGRRLITGGDDHRAHVWDLDADKEVCQLTGHTDDVWAAALSADGRRAVTGAFDGSLRVWDVEGAKQTRVIQGVSGQVRCLALSPNGKLVASGQYRARRPAGIVRLWDVETGKEIRACNGHTREVSGVAFSPDGKTLLSASFDGTVRLWDAVSGQQLRCLKGHTGRVESAAFADSGRLTVSCGDEEDHSVRVWETASGRELYHCESVLGGFMGVAALPDGRHALTTGKDSLVRLWRWNKSSASTTWLHAPQPDGSRRDLLSDGNGNPTHSRSRSPRRLETYDMKTRIIALLIGILGFATPDINAANLPEPVKVFILAGQSNMEGQAVADLDGKNYNDGKGTLNALLKDPAKAPLVKHLKTEKGEWAVRDDVWVRYQREQQPLLAGPLTMGFSVYGDKHHFGPELQFGHVVGDHFTNQVLLIKTAWGGKSLYKDFRPPSSGGEVGPYYTKMIADVRKGLDNLKTDFPVYADQGYELAGFVWYHGWNDGVEPKKAVPEYEQNLVNLIKDVRKDLKAPTLPFVIGELTGPWVQAPGAWAKLRKAQAAAAARPEFKGTVLFVETHDFVRAATGVSQPRPRAPRVRQRGDLLPGRRRPG